MFITIIIFILTLLVLVVSHEFGHFITAKKFGVKVLEFGFGIPPRIWGKKVGETLVSVNWLPIGGFVRLFGEDETNKKNISDPRSFASKPVLQRIIIVVAGAGMNVILASIIFWITLAVQGFHEQVPLLAPYRFFGVNQTNDNIVLVEATAPGSPAENKLQPGERIIAVNNVQIKDADQLNKIVKAESGKEIILTLKELNGKTKTVTIIPRENPPAGQGAMGVALGSIKVANLSYDSPLQKLSAGFIRSYNFTAYSFNILGDKISQAFTTKNLAPVSGTVSGPVGITTLSNTILQTKDPLLPYLEFIALLSLNLGVINLFPFPALDGGRLLFLLIEAVTRRRVNPEIEKLVHTVGMAILIALFVLITFSDVSKFIR